MSKLTIVDNILKFTVEATKAFDRSLNRMAIDIERLSKQQVPHNKGQLKSSGFHRKVGTLKYEVVYNKEYARFQEFGGDGKRVVRNYSKPGKKAFYLRDPGDLVSSRSLQYIKNESSKIRI